jgi:IS5 family transposase
MRFPGLKVNDAVPDEKTIRYFREKLREKGKIEKVFELFSAYLTDKGVMAHSGSIVDASIVEAPKQRNSREENELIKHIMSPMLRCLIPKRLRTCLMRATLAMNCMGTRRIAADRLRRC